MFQKLHKPLSEFTAGIAIIFALLWLGTFISDHTGGFLPGSIVGMLLLTVALQLGIIRLNWVQRTSNQFVRWMSLLFVPIGVGLVDQLAVLQSALVEILVTCVVATLVLLSLIGWGVQWLQRLKGSSKEQAQ